MCSVGQKREATRPKPTDNLDLASAEEVADVVTFLASPRSVSITGDAVVCAGGMPGAIYY